MSKTSIVIESKLDSNTISQINELRRARLSVAKQMLEDVDLTAHRLKSGGHLESAAEFSKAELRNELEHRVLLMEKRIQNPQLVYEDELNMYADLIAEA